MKGLPGAATRQMIILSLIGGIIGGIICSETGFITYIVGLFK